MRPLPLLTPAPPSALSRLTVVLALALGAALAWAMIVELRFQRRTAEKVTADYVTLLARERVDAAAGALNAALVAELGAQVSGTMASVFEELPPPASREESAGVLSCRDAGAPVSSYFRIDLRDRAFLTTPASSAASMAWVPEAVTADMRSIPLPAGSFQTLPSHNRLVIYGVKYAPYNAPVAVYGMVTCLHAITSVVARAHSRSAADSIIDIFAVAIADTMSVLELPNRPVLARTSIAGIVLTAYPAFGSPLSGVVIERDGVPSIALVLMLLGTIALGSVAVLQLVRDRRAVRRQAELITTVSHELRTPLAQILLYSETLALDRVRGDDARRAAAQRIVDEARRLIDTVSNVVGLTRPERASSAAPVRMTPVASVIESAITRVCALSDARARIAVSVSGAPRVRVAESVLLQALTNVIDNALKFGPPTQTVMVSAAREGALVRITVDDEGPGIAPALRERIFDRYFRATNAEEAEGAGIGLWVVRDIVVQAGGCVRAESASGGGARIVLDLPAADDS